MNHYLRQPDGQNFAKPGISGIQSGTSEISGVSGLIPGVSGLPSPEFPGLYPELSPECSKSGVFGLIPGVSGFYTVFAPETKILIETKPTHKNRNPPRP